LSRTRSTVRLLPHVGSLLSASLTSRARIPSTSLVLGLGRSGRPRRARRRPHLGEDARLLVHARGHQGQARPELQCVAMSFAVIWSGELIPLLHLQSSERASQSSPSRRLQYTASLLRSLPCCLCPCIRARCYEPRNETKGHGMEKRLPGRAVVRTAAKGTTDARTRRPSVDDLLDLARLDRVEPAGDADRRRDEGASAQEGDIGLCSGDGAEQDGP
jgi:hypothetical protein